MIKYREHRGSLEESLKTSMEFDTIKKLLDFLAERMWSSITHEEKIKLIQIMYYGFDERCNQELYIVSYEQITEDGLRCGVFGFIYEDKI